MSANQPLHMIGRDNVCGTSVQQHDTSDDMLTSKVTIVGECGNNDNSYNNGCKLSFYVTRRCGVEHGNNDDVYNGNWPFFPLISNLSCVIDRKGR